MFPGLNNYLSEYSVIITDNNNGHSKIQIVINQDHCTALSSVSNKFLFLVPSPVLHPLTISLNFLDIFSAEQLVWATGVWLMLPQQYTINSYQEQKFSEWIIHYQMCSHLVSASSSLSQPETLIPQMMAQHSKLSSTTTWCRGGKLYKHWLLSTRRTHTWKHTHPSTSAAAAASSMCYFANCNPGQDNKMASRHFVNISVLAQSTPGRLLTDRCVDWILLLFFFHRSSALVCQTVREQVEASAQGGEKGSLMQSSSLKSGTKHLSGGRDAANQCLWLVQQYVKRRWYTPQLWSCLGSSGVGWC